MKKLLVVDGKALAYKAFSSGNFSGAVSASGQNVSMLAHFMSYIIELMGKYEPTALTLVFGSTQEKNQEIEDNPVYKIQFALLKVLVKSLDVHAIFSEELALDVIKTVILKAEEKDYKSYVASACEGALQLLSKRTHVILFSKGRDVHYNPNKFYLEYGIDAAFYADMLALTGRGNDHVPGVPGIGQKTATRIIQEYGRCTNILRDLSVVTDYKLRELLDLYQEEIVQGYTYETLEVIEEMPFDFDKIQFSGFSKDSVTVMEHFGISGLLSKAEDENEGLPLFEYMQ